MNEIEECEKRVRLFKSQMSLHGDTLDTLANYLGIVRQTLSRKIKREVDFTQTEMSMIKSRYELTDEEFNQIFIKECHQVECTGSSQEIK